MAHALVRAGQCGAERSGAQRTVRWERRGSVPRAASSPARAQAHRRRGSPKPSQAKLDHRSASQAGRQVKHMCGPPPLSAVAMRAHGVSLFGARGEGEYWRRDLGRKAELGLDDLLLKLVAVLVLQASQPYAVAHAPAEAESSNSSARRRPGAMPHVGTAVRCGKARHAASSPRCVARVASCAARQREHGQRTAP